MKIKTKEGTEIELNPEELRHFKINSAEEVKNFVEKIETDKQIGFKQDEPPKPRIGNRECTAK